MLRGHRRGAARLPLSGGLARTQLATVALTRVPDVRFVSPRLRRRCRSDSDWAHAHSTKTVKRPSAAVDPSSPAGTDRESSTTEHYPSRQVDE